MCWKEFKVQSSRFKGFKVGFLFVVPCLCSVPTRKSMRFSSNYNSPSKLEGVPVGGGRVSVKFSLLHTPPAYGHLP